MRPKINSMTGYTIDIDILQDRHLAFKTIKLIRGILSYHFIVLKQYGQNENPLKGDKHSLGNLNIQTFAKLPIQIPITNSRATL